MTKKRFNSEDKTKSPLLCAWCQKPFQEDDPVYAIGGKATPEFDLEANRGSILDIPLESVNRTVSVIVAGKDSNAAKEGKDLIFTVCSTTCGAHLKKALADDLGLSTYH